MNIFKRLFKIGQAEAHSAIDGLENPIKMTEQGIRDMKADLDKSLQALAEIKAMAIRSKNDMARYKSQAADYEKKAIELLNRAKSGQLDAAEADRLAETSLQKQQDALSNYNRAAKENKRFDENVAKMEANIRKLRNNIGKWENELKTLKARAKVSKATKNVNKQMAQIDSSSTISMLERMKEKVEKDEALAESYADIAYEAKSVDEEIEKALDVSDTSSSDALLALKQKLNKPTEDKDNAPDEPVN